MKYRKTKYRGYKLHNFMSLNKTLRKWKNVLTPSPHNRLYILNNIRLGNNHFDNLRTVFLT